MTRYSRSFRSTGRYRDKEKLKFMSKLQILTKELEELGLYLTEHEDFIYLKRGDVILAKFYAPLVRIQTIRQIARGFVVSHETKRIPPE